MTNPPASFSFSIVKECIGSNLFNFLAQDIQCIRKLNLSILSEKRWYWLKMNANQPFYFIPFLKKMVF